MCHINKPSEGNERGKVTLTAQISLDLPLEPIKTPDAVIFYGRGIERRIFKCIPSMLRKLYVTKHNRLL